MLNCFQGVWVRIGGKLRRSKKLDPEESDEPRLAKPRAARAVPPSAPTFRARVRKPTVVDPANAPVVNIDLERPLPNGDALAAPQRLRDNSISSDHSHIDGRSSTRSGHALRAQLREARFKASEGDGFVVPASHQVAILTAAAIENDIKAQNESISCAEAAEYAKKASECARSLYATLAYTKKGGDICRLLKDGITDKDLPLMEYDGGKTAFALRKRDGAPVEVMEDWEAEDLEEFSRVQFWMTSPIFKLQKHYELEDQTVIPFPKLKASDHGLQPKQGGYSEVIPARIHPAHHEFGNIFGSEDEEGPLVAVKNLYDPDEKEFLKEREILTTLGRKDHPHLIKLLATYKHRGKYHLMFPYAESNLRGFWEDPVRQVPSFDRKTVLWSLEQMRGLASALQLIHNFKVTLPLSVPGKVRLGEDNVKMSVEGGEELFGRHGDLKPENILWFAPNGDPENPFGVLKIADFGLGRFHGRDSRSRINPSTVKASPTYEPPECKLHKPVSRKYDLWSLGCVFLEFITYLIKGSGAIDTFADRRGHLDSLQIDNDNFFSIIHGIDGNKAILKDEIHSWVKELRSQPSCSHSVHDLLDIIMNGLLVVDPDERINSSMLYRELDKLTKRADRDEQYLLSPAPRQMRTDSAPAGLCVPPKTHGRRKSATAPNRDNTSGYVRTHSEVPPRTALPRDLVGRSRGTPSLMKSTKREIYKTWPERG